MSFGERSSPDAVDGVFGPHGRVSPPMEMELGEDVLAAEAAVVNAGGGGCVNLNLSWRMKRGEPVEKHGKEECREWLMGDENWDYYR